MINWIKRKLCKHSYCTYEPNHSFPGYDVHGRCIFCGKDVVIRRAVSKYDLHKLIDNSSIVNYKGLSNG